MGHVRSTRGRARFVVAAGLAGVLVGCSTATSTTTTQPTQPAVAVSGEPTGRPRQMFSSLGDLARGSDAVVVGTIVSVRPGRTAGDPRDGVAGEVQFFDVAIEIEEGLAGPRNSGEITIEVLFLAGIRGSIFSVESPWWRPEASSVFFLNLDTGLPGRQAVLVSPQGLYFLPDGFTGKTAASGPDSIPGAVGLTVEEFRTLIADFTQ